VRIRRGSGGARKLVEVDGDTGEVARRLVGAVGAEGEG